MAGNAIVSGGMVVGNLNSAAAAVGGEALVTGETDALGIDFTYHTLITKQMHVITSSVGVNSAPYESLTYTSPSLKLTRQSDGVWRYANHNILLQSQVLGTSWTTENATMTADATTAPDGTSTAESFVENGTNSLHRFYQQITAATGFPVVISIWAKATGTGSTRYLHVRSGHSGGAYATATFDLSAGGSVTQNTVSGYTSVATSVTDAGSGWVRCSFTYISTGANPFVVVMLSNTGTPSLDANGDISYAGDSTSGLYLWGAQAKRYPVNDAVGYTYATGYIATTTATKYDLPYEWDASNASQGILIEEQRTNILVRSQEFDNASWAKASLVGNSVTANATTAPDGTTTADKAVPDTSSGVNHGVTQTGLTVANAAHAVSFFAKPSGYNYIEILVADSNSYTKYVGVSFNVSTGSVVTTRNVTYTGTGSIVDAGNGWYRCTVVTSALDANSTTRVDFNISAADDFATGSTGNGTDGAYLWGAQLEAGAFATSSIHTIGATVTRAVDTSDLATSSFVHDATEGTLYAKFRPINVGAIRYALVLDDGTANELIAIGSTAAGAGGLTVTDGGAAQTDPLTNGTVTAAATNKVAASWSANDFAISTNGTAASTDTSGTLPTVTSLGFGTAVSSTNPLNGHLMHVVHLPRPMSDADLATRST